MAKNCDIGTNCKSACIQASLECRANLAKEFARDTDRVKAFLKGQIPEATVNTVGTLSNLAATSVGGPLAGLAAELAGSLLTRRSLQDAAAVSKVLDRKKQDERFQKARKVDQIREVLAEAAEELKKDKDARKKEIVADALGFTVGNLGAQLPVPIPLKGAFIAMATMPKIMDRLDPYLTTQPQV